MIHVSPELYRLAQDYLDRVARGDLSEERADAHERLMVQMRAEGIEYRNRADARRKAYWFTAEPSIVIAYWKLLVDFLGERLDEYTADPTGIETSLPNLCAPC